MSLLVQVESMPLKEVGKHHAQLRDSCSREFNKVKRDNFPLGCYYMIKC